MWRSLLLSAALFCGCKHSGGEEPELKKPEVKVAVVAEEKISPRTTVAGVLAPLPGKDVKVGALVPGRVDRIFVAEGDAVKVGQPLAHVEAEPLRQNVSQAAAQRDQAVAALQNARTRLDRAERLFKDGISAKQEVDDARAGLVAAESAVRSAQATGGIAGVQLDRATLRAPIAGVVAAILVPAGQPVDGNGTPVIEVADTQILNLRAPVSASLVGDVSVGQRAELEVEGVGTVGGEVEAIAPLVDPTTNTVVVRIRIPNAAGKLRGGMFARGAILGAPHPALAVPRTALLPGDGGTATSVAVVDGEGVVSHRGLTLGVEAGDRIEVKRGLVAGERVIVAGGYALPDGTKVDVTK
ncbi:MAG: Cobalt/zinc/cadmium efflux transporter, rane fusion protein CzcB family [Myxococcales bacterium]|nr:Cobalt/zinc/cadmium efflux transporter, rane fusion protein CzcB family [Myxococcales bacterium]